MEFIKADNIVSMSNPGVVSRQLLNPDKDDMEKEFCAGDVVRFADNDIHGLRNDGKTEFVYISVTAPPIHFGYAYEKEK